MSEISERVIKWLEGRPVWTSYAIYDIVSGIEIEDKKIDEYAELCLQETKNNHPARKEIQSELLGRESTETVFSLTKLEDMKNINAIDSEAKLEFGSQGISVIYGNNGSGKSGYVRTLKKACGVSYSESIRANVFSKKREDKQTCKITVSKMNGSVEDVLCDFDEKNPEALSGIEIFDTIISQSYIGDSKEASYEPWIFSVLVNLAQIADRIKSRLQNKGDQVEIVIPIVPVEIENEQLIQAMRSINAQSKFEPFDIKWTESQENELQALEKIIGDNSPQKSIDIAKSRLKNLQSLIDYSTALSAYVSKEHIMKINFKRNELIKVLQEKEAVELLFSQKSDGVDTNSITLVSWKKLWQYARQYTIEISNGETDIPSKICPLCHQSLNDDILKRYQTIDEFVNSQVNKNIADLSTQFAAIITPIFKSLNASEHELLLSNCGFENIEIDVLKKLLDDATRLVDNMSTRIVELTSLEDSSEAIDLSQLFSAVSTAIELETERLNKYTIVLDSEERAAMLNEQQMHQTHKLISGNKELIRQAIDKSKERDNYYRSVVLTVTNSITKFINSLADDLLTKEYESNFNDELMRLTAGSVKVRLIKAKGGKGRVPYKIVVVNQNDEEFKPNDILSEGERRAVSLAAFLADTSNGQRFTPLIFDDPISSLDFEYETRTIDRLVQIAEKRQVIVFTHRISMVYGLSEQCKKTGISFFERSIYSVQDKKGVAGSGILEKSRVKGRINKLIQDQLPALKKAEFNSAIYLTIQSGLCAEFRNIVEKSIEEILLCGIAQRFDRVIHSSLVMRLSKLTTADCEIIDRMMTKYSSYDHSQPDEAPTLPIGYAELFTDFSEMKKWIDEANSRLIS